MVFQNFFASFHSFFELLVYIVLIGYQIMRAHVITNKICSGVFLTPGRASEKDGRLFKSMIIPHPYVYISFYVLAMFIAYRNDWNQVERLLAANMALNFLWHEIACYMLKQYKFLKHYLEPKNPMH